MPTKITTGRVRLDEVRGLAATLRVVASPEFVERSMDIRQVGEDTLAYLKRIFPKSPPEYPSRGRRSLVEGWKKVNHPPYNRNPGFTIRRDTSDERDRTIIASLDQGSRAYSRIIPKGAVTSFLKTSDRVLRPVDIGQPVFVTGNQLIFRYKGRRGMKFMDRTFNFTQRRMDKARRDYWNAVRRKIQ